MQLIKTFEATGIAPNGKLYAGDLNAIQTAAAAQADLTQTIDLGTVRIGEVGLTLSRIGSLEAQLQGDLRVTKILRGLEGIIPGAFTTAQRNAIAAGRAPYGVAILNSEKNKWEWNAGTDGARVWTQFGAESGVGLLSARPTASSVGLGGTYFATDQVTEYRSDGTTWHRTSLPAGATMAWFAAAGTVPTGWVKYDGANLPSAVGIYADLATHLGGVTTPNTKGRVIVGQDPGDVDFDAMWEYRGAKTHTLTIAEMPSHNHGGSTGSTAVDRTGGDGASAPVANTGGNAPTSHSHSIPAQGGDGAHNNIQPSVVGVYVAKL